jgi:hypothetical protein
VLDDVLDYTLVGLGDVVAGSWGRRTTCAHVVSAWGVDAPGT